MSHIAALDQHDELDAILARTALKYDLLPYTSNPFPQSHPGRLSAVATLFGLETAPLATARVLELGCAGGGNVIPLAVAYPDARFVGVDLSRTQIAAGRARIARLGLANIELQCQSFTELGAEDGEFDYIVCHGVYSWAPAPVREAILKICGQRLSAQGVAYVSYNVLPGWRMLQTARDICLLAAADQSDPRQRVAQARAVMAFVKEHGLAPTGPYKQALDGLCDLIANQPDDYIAHEFLEEVNEPCTFSAFAAAAGREGLGFLGEVEIASMAPENYPAQTAAKLREVANDQVLATEQYLDLLNGRTFRQSLLVHAARWPQIDRKVADVRLEPLHVLGRGDLALRRDDAGVCTLADSAGRSLTTTSAAVGEALGRLVERFPASSNLDDLLADAPQAERTEENRALLRDALLKMALNGLVATTSAPVAASPAPSETPKVWALVADDARRGAAHTTNLRHERVELDAVAHVLLPALDGETSSEALADLLVRAGQDGRLSFAKEGVPVRDAAAMRPIAEEQTAVYLQRFARCALLTG